MVELGGCDDNSVRDYCLLVITFIFFPLLDQISGISQGDNVIMVDSVFQSSLWLTQHVHISGHMVN
jgi:hypothetical protein